MSGTRSLWMVMAALLPLFAARTANAQDAEATPEMIPESAEATEDGMPPGWHPMLKASGSFALGQSKNVPGTADGLSMNFGYLILGGLDYISETREHEWANDLSAQLGYSRTPVVDAWLKSMDTIDFKSTYLYHIPDVPWLGPFVAFRLTAPMLPGYDVRAEETTTYKLKPGEEQVFDTDGNLVNPDRPEVTIDGTSDRVKTHESGEKIDLTGAFAPLTLRESVGLFAIPVDKTEFKLDIRAGFGAWETFPRDGYVLEDNADTDQYLELRQMQDVVQMGPELGINIGGQIRDNVTYAFNALFMQPVYHTAETDLKGIELMNAEFDFALGVKLWEYASLDYTFKAYKQPLIVDDWQIHNGLLFSLTFNVVPGWEPPEEPACPVCPEEAPAAAEEPAAEEPAPALEPAPAEPAAEPAPEEPAAAPEGPPAPAPAPEEPAAEEPAPATP